MTNAIELLNVDTLLAFKRQSFAACSQKVHLIGYLIQTQLWNLQKYYCISTLCQLFIIVKGEACILSWACLQAQPPNYGCIFVQLAQLNHWFPKIRVFSSCPKDRDNCWKGVQYQRQSWPTQIYLTFPYHRRRNFDHQDTI